MDAFPTDDNLVFLQLHPGDHVLESIEATIEEHDIQTGVVVSGIGSLRKLRLHYPTEYGDFPAIPDDFTGSEDSVADEAVWEVGSLQGAIIDHDPHLHISAYNGDRDRMLAGHLEPGSIVHALMEIVIRTTEAPDLVRRPTDTGIAVMDERSTS